VRGSWTLNVLNCTPLLPERLRGCYADGVANPDHLSVLLQGVEQWNTWRRAHPRVIPDLICANLLKADLAGDTSHGANLYRANLRGAKLIGANLHGVNLRDAELAEALLGDTIFGNTNLTGAHGLDACRHSGPSVIDFQTLAKSGSLPLAFLRGCGLSDALIDYLPSFLNTPIHFYSCFISYSTKDQDFADRLHADLQNKGVRCWFAPEDLKIGDRFRQRIDEAIRLHDKLLLILSEHSVRSDWVREEVESCLEREHREKRTVLFPVRVDDAVIDTNEAWAASIRRQRHMGDFRRWKDHDSYQKAFERLMRDLKAQKVAP
jgi:TIR domain-containing protein/pentapeptide repeat protein